MTRDVEKLPIDSILKNSFILKGHLRTVKLKTKTKQ